MCACYFTLKRLCIYSIGGLNSRMCGRNSIPAAAAVPEVCIILSFIQKDKFQIKLLTMSNHSAVKGRIINQKGITLLRRCSDF